MKSAMIRMALVLAGAATLVILAVFAPLLLRASMRSACSAWRSPDCATWRRRCGAAAGISAASNVFDDAWTWRDACSGTRACGTVSITRELPGTLRLRVTESAPVAFARTPELRAWTSAASCCPSTLRPMDSTCR
jgi:hypothetical protein